MSARFKSVLFCVILFIIFFLFSDTSAHIIIGPNQLRLALRPGTHINQTRFEKFCKSNNCTLEDAQTTYKSSFTPEINVAIEKTEQFPVIDIIAPQTGAKFSYLSFNINVKDMSNEQILELIQNVPEKWDLRDSFGLLCASGMNCSKYGNCGPYSDCLLSSDEKITEAKSKNLTKLSFITEEPLYTTKDEALNEIEVFLKNYNVTLPSDVYIYNAPVYSVDLKTFDWVGALSFELDRLLSDKIIYGNFKKMDIESIAQIDLGPGMFVYFKPDGCRDSFIDDVLDDNNSYGWLIAPGNCEIMEYKNNCPAIACFK